MRQLIRNARRVHRQHAAPSSARQLGRLVPKFVKVMPKDYKRVLAEQKARASEAAGQTAAAG